ncbi:MAG: M23 family metallopeptidase [Anaerotruncus sp.]|nr:M23 family metallopeptidase [Anaerotruncus sp.]
MNEYNPKSKFSKFMAGKGFYVALAICVIGAGTAAWVAVDKTIDRIDGNNNEIVRQEPSSSRSDPSYGFPDLEEAGKAQSGIEAPSSSSAPSSSTPQSSSSAASSAPSEPSELVAAQPQPQAASFVLPAAGEIFAPFSNGELVKNPTLKEWRTHDGIDIRAEEGSVVKAVSDGVVTAVSDDPLMGMTVEIEHSSKLVSIYCGLNKKVNVKQGDQVTIGQEIGKVGEIPCEVSLESHLHFAMKQDGKWVDPLKAMDKMA